MTLEARPLTNDPGATGAAVDTDAVSDVNTDASADTRPADATDRKHRRRATRTPKHDATNRRS